MKRFFIYTLICSLTALMGCDKNDEVMNDLATTNGKKVTVTANIQGDAATRVTLTPDTDESENPIVKVDWNERDETFNAYADGAAEPIIFTQIDGTNRFEGTLNGTAPYTLYYGDKDYDLSTQNGTLNEECVLMQATATDFSTTIDFEHKTAILKPTFKVGVEDIDASITQIVVEGIKNPTATTESGNITVTPSALGDIYIFLPAFESYTADHTFTFIVTAGGQDYLATLTIPNGKSIEAGKFYTAAITIAAIPYLTFTAQGEQTFKMDNNWGHPLPNTLQYSVDGNNWETLTAGAPINFGGAKGNLRLRGNSSTGTAKDDMDFSYIEFENSTPVACTGDIRTLVDYTDYENADTSGARFCGLFYECSALTTAPALPATTLAVHCYYNMFYGCTSLTTAPALPATNLADNCYQSMFYGCTSLTTAPALPATTLKNNCYSTMFYGCTSLTTAPTLPATTLKNNCYAGMFFGCSELATAPTLPATTLADGCYMTMFMDCTSLATAPVLPATTLKNNCYALMFMNCTSLNSITMLATDISANNCLGNWVTNVAATGTFYKNSAATWENDGVVPSEWEVQNYSVTP